MSHQNANVKSGLTPAVLFGYLNKHRWLVLGPAAACCVLAAVASLVMPRQHRATQGFIIRGEAAGYAEQRLGKFTDLSEMKTVQETVLELARSQSVVTEALQSAGAPRGYRRPSQWPTLQDVVDFRDSLRVSPPGGAEFGQTEVFYVSVLDPSPARAKVLVSAMTTQLEKRMQDLRDNQAGSMVAELENSVEVARGKLAVETSQLGDFESQIGADLAELRNLQSPLGGQSEIGQQRAAIAAEIRQLDAKSQSSEELLMLLNATDNDLTRFLATPSALLAGQPSLQQLKETLTQTKIRAARLQGTLAASHPFVLAAAETQQHLQDEILRSIPNAIVTAKANLALYATQKAALKTKVDSLETRLASLAKHRSHYSNLLNRVTNQTSLVDSAERQLASAYSHKAGAKSASVLARIDKVEASLNPIGPGRATTTLAGGLAGLLLGLGATFFFYPVELETAETPTTTANASPEAFSQASDWNAAWYEQSAQPTTAPTTVDAEKHDTLAALFTEYNTTSTAASRQAEEAVCVG